MTDQATAVAQSVVQRLMARSYEANPELREPFPLDPVQIEAYSTEVKSLTYPQLLASLELMGQDYDLIKDYLPPERTNLLEYPHPVLQRKLVLLNDLYRRSVESPKLVSSYNANKTMFEWAMAGGIAGGAVGYLVVGKQTLSGAIIGMTLGALAGRSEVVQRLFLGLASNIAAL